MRYPGSKNQRAVFSWIINQMPPHQIFWELCAGSGAVLRHKKPAERNYAVDLDPAALDLLRSTDIPNLKLIQGDALAVLDVLAYVSWSAEEARQTLIYIDPPYLESVRKSRRRLYRYELMTEPEHERLLNACLNFPGRLMLSGYDSALYRKALGPWRRSEIQTTNRAGAKVTECLWMNFPEPYELHDYRYLGTDRTQRQYYKRYEERMKAKLKSMPPLRRAALLKAVDDLRSTAAGDGCG
jgi:DNA adenine methylase